MVLRIAIGAQLRVWREAARLDRHVMSRLLGVSVAKARMIEQGVVPLSEADVVVLLERYGVGGELRAGFLAVLHSYGSGGAWWRRDHAHPGSFDPYPAAVQAAQLIRIAALEVIPRLLQTPDYTRTMGRIHGLANKVIDRQIQEAEERYAALITNGSQRLWIVVGPTVLHQAVAEPGVMRRQLEHLLQVAESPAVALQLVGPEHPPLPNTSGPFSIIRFADSTLPDVVHLPQFTGSLYLEHPDDVEDYHRAWNNLAMCAEPPMRTLGLLAEPRVRT